MHTALRHWRGLPAPIRWSAIAVACIVALIAALALFDWNLARGVIERAASKRMDREVHIEGPLDVRLFSSAPTLEIRQLRIRNPAWFGPGSFATVERFKASIEIAPLLRGRIVLRTLEIEKPALWLSRAADGRANWWLRPTRDAARPAKLPAVRHFRLQEGTLHIDDDFRKLAFRGKIHADEKFQSGIAEPFRLRGAGTLNGESFTLVLTGSPLANIRVEEPYDFTAVIDAGATHARFKGAVEEPFDLARLATTVEVSGRNLADLYYLSGLPFPLTSEYRLTARMKRDGIETVLTKIAGRVGQSDLRGTATIKTGGQRPLVTADLRSHSLHLRDLGVAFGGEPVGSDNAVDGGANSTSAAVPDRLLPDRDLRFDRLAQVDVNMDFRADAVQTKRVPFESVMIKLRQADGVMRLNPVVFELPQGSIAGTLTLDTRARVPVTEMDLQLGGVRLEQFKPKKAQEGPMSGTLVARAQLQGYGRSVHDIAATADGTMTAVVPRGEVREAIVELTGINVLRGLGLLLSQSKETAKIRCGVAEFKVTDGRAKAERIVLDTDHVLVVGDGSVDLDTETVDIELSGKPKKLRVGRLRSPVTVAGTLRRPAFGIEAEEVAMQAAIATTLGALANPIVAALAFVDPGLAKNADCAALIAEAGVVVAPAH